MPSTQPHATHNPLRETINLADRYKSEMLPRLPDSIDPDSINFNLINEPESWESVYQELFFGVVPIHGRVNAGSLISPDKRQIIDLASATKESLPTLIKQELADLKSNPTTYLSKPGLRNDYKEKDCTNEKQIIAHIEFLLHQCLAAHQDFVAKNCIPWAIQQHLADFDFFIRGDINHHTRLDCLQSHAHWKQQIDQHIQNADQKKELKKYLQRLMDHYYESANKKTVFDKCCTFAAEVVPIFALAITIAAIVIAIMHPGAPIILVLSYLGYIGFAGSVASILTYFRDGWYGGEWKPTRMIVLDFVLTIIGAILGFFPMVAHALGHHYRYLELATRYVNLSLDLATSGVNFAKSLFMVRDKDTFYRNRETLASIESIKALPNAKISSWIIYTNLKVKKIMTDYYSWYKRLIHPARHHHELAKDTNLLIFPGNQDAINTAYEEHCIQYRLAQIACGASIVMLIALILISQPATLILGWGMMVLSISIGTVLSIGYFYYHFSMRPSERPARRFRGNLGIILGCLCIGLLITLPIAPVALSAMANLLYALAVTAAIATALILFSQAIQKAYQHTPIKVSPKVEKALRIMAQVTAGSLCVIAAYVIITIAMASCPYPLVISTLLSSTLAVLSWLFQKASQLNALSNRPRSKLILRGISNVFAITSTGIAVYAVLSITFPMLIPTLEQLILTMSQAIASSVPAIGLFTPSHIVFVTLGILLTGLITLGAVLGIITPKSIADAPVKDEEPTKLRPFLNGLATLLRLEKWKPIQENDPRLESIKALKTTVDTMLPPSRINPTGSYAKRLSHITQTMFNEERRHPENHVMDTAGLQTSIN